jgi:hypothetical protein
MAFNREKFVWRGLGLHWCSRKRPVLTLVPHPTYPHLYCIKYPNGWTSTFANLSRAKDAAIEHARYLLGRQTPSDAAYSPETDALEHPRGLT